VKSALFIWKNAVSREKTMKHAARKVLGKWMFGGLSRSFERWAQVTGESKRLKAKAKTVIYRIKNACAAKCLSHWANQVRLWKRAKRMLSVLLKKSMVCCFYEWREHVKTKKETSQRLQHAARKVLGKWMFGGLSRSFERWAQVTGESKRLKAKAKTVIYRIKNQAVDCCFYFWNQFIKGRKQLKTKFAATGRLVLGRMLKFQAAKAFSRWTCVVRDVKNMNECSRKVIFRMLHSMAARFFDCWLDKTHMSKGLRGLEMSRSSRTASATAHLATRLLQLLRVRVLKQRALRVCWRITRKRWNACVFRQYLHSWMHVLRSNSRKREVCVAKLSNNWKRRIFAEFVTEVERTKRLDSNWSTIQMNRTARALQRATFHWAQSAARSTEISRGMEYLSAIRRRQLLAQAFCIQRDACRIKSSLERKMTKAFNMKLLTKIVVMWYNDAAKSSIVTKRSVSSSGHAICFDIESSLGGNENSTEFDDEFRASSSTKAPSHLKRRASVHAYSQFMNAQLQKANLELESSFTDNSHSKTFASQIALGETLLSPGLYSHESPANLNIGSFASNSLSASDL
jgi:hypothetical protein